MPQQFRFFRARVSAVTDLTPGFRRFTFAGEDLAAFGDPGYDQRIKVVFPLDGVDFDELPQCEDWYTRWRDLPTDRRHPFRTYTTRLVRREACEVDVDMVVHEVHGPASEWIQGATVGDEVCLLGPDAGFVGESGGVDFVPPARTDRFLLCGDETAAPAIATILEQLGPDARGIAVVEVPDTADCAYLPSHPGIEVRAVGRCGRPRGQCLTAETRRAVAELAPVGAPQHVEEIDVDRDLLWEVPRHAKGGAALSSTSLYAWLAGEAGTVKQLRRHLVTERGIDRRTVAFMGYWREGRAENA